jgi:hypothetical protein
MGRDASTALTPSMIEGAPSLDVSLAVAPILKGSDSIPPINISSVFGDIGDEKSLMEVSERGWPLKAQYARLATLEYYRGVVRNDGDMRGVEDIGQKYDLGVLLQGEKAKGLAKQIISDGGPATIEKFRRGVLDHYMAQYAIMHTLHGMAEISDAKGTFWEQCVADSRADNKEWFVKNGGPDFGETLEGREQMYLLLSQSKFFMDSIRPLVDAIPASVIRESAKRLVVAEENYQKDMSTWCGQYPIHEVCEALKAAPSGTLKMVGGGHTQNARALTQEDIDAMQRDQTSREASHRDRVSKAQLGGKALRGGHGA